MNSAIEQMLKSYQVENIYDKENAMKEIIQEIALSGLSRAGFFDKAAFYGGTALRIFYFKQVKQIKFILSHMRKH